MRGSPNLFEGGPHPDPSQPVAAVGETYRVALKTRSEFQRASRGRRFNVKTLTLQYIERPPQTGAEPRFGLTVTKRVGNAVERNRIKRRFRAVLRTAGLAAKPAHDYVIVARREALTGPFSGLVADLTKTLEQARTGRASSRGGRRAGRSTEPGATS